MEVRFAFGDRAGPLSTPLCEQARQLLQVRDAALDMSTILAIDAGVVIGALTVQVDDTCPIECLGDLPSREAFVTSFAWAPADWSEAPVLLAAGIARIRARHGVDLQWRFSQKDARCGQLQTLAGAAGMSLFQAKRSYGWDLANPPREDGLRLSYRSIDEVGQELFCQLITASGEGTLDRNDAWYRSRAGASNWGKAFMGYYDPRHAKTWLVAYNRASQPVGFIAISSLGVADTATITYVGVLPAYRGAKVIDDLLRCGVRASRRAGFVRMRSDADVENIPMCQAFERNGHTGDQWQQMGWHYRVPCVSNASPSSHGL